MKLNYLFLLFVTWPGHISLQDSSDRELFTYFKSGKYSTRQVVSQTDEVILNPIMMLLPLYLILTSHDIQCQDNYFKLPTIRFCTEMYQLVLDIKELDKNQIQSFNFFPHIKAFPLIEVNICFRWFHHNYDLVGPSHCLDLRKWPNPQPFFKYKQNISNTFKYLAIEQNIPGREK